MDFMKWTKEENELVKTLWLDKKSSNEISRIVGRSRSAIMSKVRKLGLTGLGGTIQFKKIEKITFKDASIEAWDECIIPYLKKLCDEIIEGADENIFDACLFLLIVAAKEYAEDKFIERVTGWNSGKVYFYMRRAKKANFILEDRKPNTEFFNDEEHGDLNIILMCMVVGGVVKIDGEKRYSIGDIDE